MALINPPEGYYFRDNLRKRILFREGFPLQSAELNDLQLMTEDKFDKLARTFYRDGNVVNDGCKITTAFVGANIQVSISAGQVFALGYIHDVPADTVNITGVGTEVVNLVIISRTITETDDPSLNDPATGAENANKPGAHRQDFNYDYVVGGVGIPFATFENGQLVLAPVNQSTILQQIEDMMALRTREKDGQFFTTLPNLQISDTLPIANDPPNMKLQITGGVGYVQGYRRPNTVVNLSIDRTLESTTRNVEPEPFITGTLVYNLDNPPVMKINQVVATLQSPAFSMTRGQVVNGSDPIPSQYQPPDSVVSITQAPSTTFTAGVDFDLSGNFIVWRPGGTQPATGTTYTVTLKYNKILTKGIRTRTAVTAESHTVATGAITLAHGKIEFLNVYKTSDDSLVAPSDYTLNSQTGGITFSGVSNGTDLYCDYSYWAHTIEGDYLGRDSFRNSDGTFILNSQPAKTFNNHNINYKSQITFDTTGNKPVNGSSFTVTYDYALARKDTLVQKQDGRFLILKGTPGVIPVAPSVADEYLPVAKIHLPAECVAADVKFERFNNETMKVVQLRQMYRNVQNILYNQAQFQLVQDTLNKPTATDKRGVFADPCTDFDLTDMGHEDTALALDALGRNFTLPRTMQSFRPVLTSPSCNLSNGIWNPPFTSEVVISQPFSSGAVLINEFDGVNLRGKISLNRNVDSKYADDLGTITTIHDTSVVSCSNIYNYYLTSNISKRSALASQLGEKEVSQIYKQDPWYWNKIPVDNEWKSTVAGNEQALTLNESNLPANSSAIIDNEWVTVEEASTVIVRGNIDTSTLTIYGSRFAPNERAIIVMFAGRGVPLTGIDGTANETAPEYAGSVKANSSGEWTATFEIPPNTETGSYEITAYGHDPTDLTRVKTFATTTYQATAFMELQSLLVKVHDSNWKQFNEYMPYKVFRTSLGMRWESDPWYYIYTWYLIYPDGTLYGSWGVAGSGPVYNGDPLYLELYFSGNQSLARTIAIGIKQAVIENKTLTPLLLTAAISAMLAFTGLESIISATQIDQMVDAANLASSDIDANTKAILNATDVAKLQIAQFPKTYQDPVAQTFTATTNFMASGIGLFFHSIPNEQVTVSLAEVENGYPTDRYLATTWLNANEINNDSGEETVFNFSNPVYLEAGKQYSFVVATIDTSASLRISTLGQTDPVNGLITKNPNSGALFRSPNASAWELMSASDIKFNLYKATFTQPESIVNLATINFASEDISRFSVLVPFVELTDATRVIYQYSLNNTEWVDFAPMKEVDLLQMVSTLYVRVKLIGSRNLCPILFNDSTVLGFTFLTSGGWVCREFSLPTEEVNDVDVWFEVDKPGGTTAVPSVDLDQEGWSVMEEEEDEARDIDGTWFERHFTYNTSGEDKQDVRVKIALSTAANYVTPRIRNIRVVAR